MTEPALSFARSLYSEEAVREAAEAWAEVTTLTVTSSDEQDAIWVTVDDYDGDLEALCDEFANYVLVETVRRELPADAPEAC